MTLKDDQNGQRLILCKSGMGSNTLESTNTFPITKYNTNTFFIVFEIQIQNTSNVLQIKLQILKHFTCTCIITCVIINPSVDRGL